MAMDLRLRMIMNFIIQTISTLTASQTLYASGEWQSDGVIEQLWIHPTHIVVKQGPSGSTACNVSNLWSYSWNDFTDEYNDKLLSSILTAYAAEKSIQVSLDTKNCGPEGFNKFTGRVHLLP